MSGILCLMVLFAGFSGEEGTEYLIISTSLLDGDWAEFENQWFGLFEEDSLFELREVEIQLRESPYEAEEWERPNPIIIDILIEQEEPLFIVSSSEMEFLPGIVPCAQGTYQRLLVDTSYSIAAPGVQEVSLFTTEDSLFLSDDSLVQCISEIRTGDSSSECSIAIVWAGDLDRDGRMDLVIDDTSDGYNRYYWKLYLSSEAEPGSLARLVASFYDVYY
ncbi:MAG: hypothetical protein KAH54_01905 [Candidatus Sabulitectum sp.]|nr:hypothetical protein [Candidatus Sabulitectum sp.]